MRHGRFPDVAGFAMFKGTPGHPPTRRNPPASSEQNPAYGTARTFLVFVVSSKGFTAKAELILYTALCAVTVTVPSDLLGGWEGKWGIDAEASDGQASEETYSRRGYFKLERFCRAASLVGRVGDHRSPLRGVHHLLALDSVLPGCGRVSRTRRVFALPHVFAARG